MSEPNNKKTLSADRLKQLEIARAKANEVRRAGKELKEKEKALKTIEHQKRVEEVESKLKSLKVPKSVEPEPVPPTPKREKKKKIVYVEESSDDEPEVVYVKKSKPKAVPENHRDTLEPETERYLEPEHQMSQAQIKNEMARMRREMARKMMFRAY
jgi:hypothetical protein